MFFYKQEYNLQTSPPLPQHKSMKRMVPVWLVKRVSTKSKDW